MLPTASVLFISFRFFTCLSFLFFFFSFVSFLTILFSFFAFRFFSVSFRCFSPCFLFVFFFPFLFVSFRFFSVSQFTGTVIMVNLPFPWFIYFFFFFFFFLVVVLLGYYNTQEIVHIYSSRLGLYFVHFKFLKFGFDDLNIKLKPLYETVFSVNASFTV